MKLLGLLLLVIILGGFVYLLATAIVYAIFALISVGGYDIDFSVWVGGLLLLILGALFKK